MAGEGHGRPLLGGDAVGIAGRIGEARLQLAADALDGVGIEARLAQRQRQQCGGLVAVLGQRLEAAVEGIARVLEAHAHGNLFYALLELLGREIACALIEHAGQEIRQALLALRVLGSSALEGKAQRDQRNAVLLDEPGRYPAGAFHHLNLHGLRPARWNDK